MRVLVTGATGFIGTNLVPALLDRGHDVTVLVRDRTRYDPPEGVRVIEGDLLEPDTATVVNSGSGGGSDGRSDDKPDEGLADESLADEGAGDRRCSLSNAFAGIEVAYYLVHSMRAGADFENQDRHIAESFSTVATEAAIDRVIYLGGLGEEGEVLSEHLQSRREVERLLAAGAYDLTTLRAAIVVGARSAGFEMVRQLAKKLPVMITPKWVRTPCQPIAVTDAVAYLCGVLEAPETVGNTYEIGGPEVLSYETMIRRVGRELGREPMIVPLPILSPKLSSYWVQLMTDVEPSLVQPLIEGLRNPVVVTDDAINDHVHIEKTPFDVAVRRALGKETGSDASAPRSDRGDPRP